VTSRIRVGTWNVRGLRGGVPAVASVVRTEELDLLLVQESGPRRRLRALGDALGWTVCADPWTFPRRRVKNAVLAKGSSRGVVRSRLHRFRDSSILYPRGILIAELDDGLTASSIHLGLSGPERGRHIREYLQMAEARSARAILGGDLNARPEEGGPSTLAGRATDCWRAVGEGDGATFPAEAPTARIDYLFVGEAIRPLRAWTAGGAVSDHRMVVAELEID
jgi:endonuclease/exonuclease/phosphatase family metal-dependent hydrolase